MRSGPSRAAALAALILGLTSGCGQKTEHPETVPVKGKVTYKGSPVTLGTITFQSDGGQVAIGQIQSDGTYQLSSFGEGDGAVLGHHGVYVIANTGDENLMPSSPGYKVPKDLVPKKYNAAKTSGLEANVTKETKEIDFDLK